MVATCCSTCLNQRGETVLDYEYDAQGSAAEKLNNSNLLHTIDSGSGLSFPVYGKKDQTEYSVYGFLPVVESPGIALVMMKDGADQKGQVVSSSVGSNWPLFALTSLLVYVIGAVMWILVSADVMSNFVV